MNHIDDAVRVRMCRRLRELDWTLVELSEVTGHSYRNVCRWLHGDVRIPADFLLCYAKHVPVNASWLLTGEGFPEAVVPDDAERVLDQIAHVLESHWMIGSSPGVAEGIIQNSDVGVLAFDGDLRYTLWNPAMERMRCKSASTVLGKTPERMFPYLKDVGVISKLEDVLRGEIVTIQEAPYVIPGTQRPARLSALLAPIRDRNQEVVGGFGVVHDPTPWTDVLRA